MAKNYYNILKISIPRKRLPKAIIFFFYSAKNAGYMWLFESQSAQNEHGKRELKKKLRKVGIPNFRNDYHNVQIHIIQIVVRAHTYI